MRRMRWWDIEPVMALEAELFGDEAWSPTMFWSELAERDTRHYVVVDDERPGRVAAYAGLCAYGSDAAYVQTMAVRPDRQRRGLGGRLLRELLGEAERRGCRCVDLEVRADNPDAQRLYTKHGFGPVGVRRGYYQPSGTDAVVMRRELAP